MNLCLTSIIRDYILSIDIDSAFWMFFWHFMPEAFLLYGLLKLS
jgi:hypothetical protein